MKTIDLDDAVAQVRELLAMNKQELLTEVRSHPDLCGEKMKRTDLIVFAFEYKFNSDAKPPVRYSGKVFNPKS